MTSFKLVTTLTTELFIQCACVTLFRDRFVINAPNPRNENNTQVQWVKRGRG